MPSGHIVEFQRVVDFPQPKPATDSWPPNVRLSVQRSIQKLPVLGQRNPDAALLIERSIDDYMPPPLNQPPPPGGGKRKGPDRHDTTHRFTRRLDAPTPSPLEAAIIAASANPNSVPVVQRLIRNLLDFQAPDGGAARRAARSAAVTAVLRAHAEDRRRLTDSILQMVRVMADNRSRGAASSPIERAS